MGGDRIWVVEGKRTDACTDPSKIYALAHEVGGPVTISYFTMGDSLAIRDRGWLESGKPLYYPEWYLIERYKIDVKRT